MTKALRASPATEFDVHALADRQLEGDRARTARFPDLFTRKLQRMSASPLAFLRGAAPLFYELLVAHPDLADGPPGEGWLAGDLHLENFGAYRPDGPDSPPSVGTAKKRPAVFNLNDFDDAIVGPWRLDVLRLTTSLLLGGRELGANGIVCLDLADRMITAWSRAAFDGDPPPEAPAPVATLVEQVKQRPRAELLDARTEIVRGSRRFVRGPRYAELPKEILDRVPAAFEGYIATVESERSTKSSMTVIDAALRIAGTGSLGGLRIAVLVEGKGGRDGQFVFDLKEQGTPSAAVLLGEPKLDPAERVVTGFRACVAQPARSIGATKIVFPRGTDVLPSASAPPAESRAPSSKKTKSSDTTLPLFGRRLAPQEDKLNLRKLRGPDLPAIATYLGALLGAAHARGATSPVPSPWSRADREAIRTHAVTLAGVHEAVYLALCDRMRRILS